MRFITSLRFVLNDSQLSIVSGEFGGEESGAFFTPELPCPET